MFRDFDYERDRLAARRIWQEVGWLSYDADKAARVDPVFAAARGHVAEVNGEAECLVLTTPGTIRYLDEELALCVVAGVTTSRVARRMGLAARVTARAIAADAADGAQVAALGIFDQGFYNQLGFGTGGYEHWISFDPASLLVGPPTRSPRRLAASDWESAHACLMERRRGHGGCNLAVAEWTRCEMEYDEEQFGLGFCDGPEGELTHYIWGGGEVERGPYELRFVYQTYEQFLELLRLVRSFGDQITLVKMREPQGIQVQDLLGQPFRHRRMTRHAKHEGCNRADAYWQMRILDLTGCLAETHLHCPDLQFNLRVTDPIASLLPDDSEWTGVTGEYRVTLGAECRVTAGMADTLPTLDASIGAFTRMWLGVRPATGLAVTDELRGPTDLLDQLDRAFRLPDPRPDWDF